MGEDMRALKVGEIAPDFSLPAQDGAIVSLSQFKGHSPVVIFFYPKDETTICTKEVCAFRDSYEDFVKAGAIVVGISSDSAQSHQLFAGKHRLPYRLLSDGGGKVRKLFAVPNSLGLLPGRVTYVLDKESRVKLIFNSQMDAQKHVDEALRTIRQLAGGA